MAPKIYRSDGTVLIRNSDGATLEFADEDALAMARNIVAMLDPPRNRDVEYIRWTREMKETLRRMYVDEGIGPAQIAISLGTTAVRVDAMRRRMGIPGRNRDRAERARAMMRRRRVAAE